MKLHRLTNFLLMFALMLSLFGCTPAEQPDQSQPEPPSASSGAQSADETQSLPLTLPFYPDYSMHPALAENRANMILAPLIYEGLFTLDDTFSPTPVLCQSYAVSEDGLTWVFSLRQGVSFSDGTPLTGTVAAQALNTALGTGSRYAGRISGLRSITGNSDSVTITLTSPNSGLPALLDISLALDSSSRPLGTGPYVLRESAGSAALEVRGDWWQGQQLPFASIQLFSIQQADDLIAAFDSGDVTLLDADLTGTNTLGYSGSYEVWNYNTTDFIFLGFNTAKGYCSDPLARQAISRCIDRDSIATIPYARHAVAATLPFHPDSPLYNQELAGQGGYAPEVLVQFLTGHAAPKQALKLLVNSENHAKAAAADSIAYQLRTAGIDITVEKLPWDKFVSALSAGNFDLYLGEVLLTADFDLSAILSSSGALNYGRWSDAQTDSLLSNLRTVSSQARTAAANLLSAHLNEQCPITPICFKYGCVLTQWGRLSGLSPQPSNIFHALEQWTLDS